MIHRKISDIQDDLNTHKNRNQQFLITLLSNAVNRKHYRETSRYILDMGPNGQKFLYIFFNYSNEAQKTK